MPEPTVQLESRGGQADQREPAAGSTSSVVRSLPTPTLAGEPTLPAACFETELQDAENLIRYAAESGIPLDERLRSEVLAARLASSGGWTEAHSLRLLDALTQLSVRLKPVSADSLRKCVDEKEVATLKRYRRIAIALTIIIVPFSVAAFVATATCEAIRRDIETANGLAITLVRQFALDSPGAGPAPTPAAEADLKTLQQFAAANRDIYGRARTLKKFAVYSVGDVEPRPTNKDFELIPGTPSRDEAKAKIELYQRVRYFAQSIQEAVSTTFGAATACILPMLYALLGACAFLIRSFEAQMKAHTFTGTDRTTAHFLIALIGGLVVGLFGNFAGQASTLSPLAVAFLVGYAVDVFFYFLDGLLQMFSRARAEAATQPK